jgi:plasmid replication initiation protein
MDDKLIVKSNSLVEGFFSLNLNEYKTILYFISKIKKDDTEFQKQKITVTEFKELIQVKGMSLYNYMDKMGKTLVHKVIMIYRKDGYIGIPWFQYVKYSCGTLEVRFNKELESDLLDLNREFTKYKLNFIRFLNSIYSIRIYELTKQYESLKTRSITIDQLRNMLGIRDDQYKKFSDFEKRVLKTSVHEISDNTDIRISYSTTKTSRKVTDLIFDIQPTSKAVSQEAEEIVELFLQKTGETLHFDRVKELIELKGYDTVMKYVDLFDNYLQVCNMKDVARYFYAVCKNEYDLSASNSIENKPIQSTNFDQRVYDDDYFESLYDNFKT